MMMNRSLRFAAMAIICLLTGLVYVCNIAVAADKSVLQVDGGNIHTIALQSDGTVWTWGLNEDGELGNGSTRGSLTPVQVMSIEDAVYVAAGSKHSLALKRDGTVWAWGNNYYGQLGDGSRIDRAAPVQVQGLDSVVAIYAGGYHSMALKSDGTLWAWGSNDWDQLGDWSSRNRLLPVKVHTEDSIGHPLDFVAVDAGGDHNLAIEKNGTVWAWGSNSTGQIGKGPLAKPLRLLQVPNLDSVIAVSAGDLQSLALKDDGTVWEWGGLQSDYETLAKSDPPYQVRGLDSIVAIVAAGDHNLALKNDGTVWSWGQDGLGDETADPPVQVQDSGSINTIASGDYPNFIIRNDGTLWAWGNNLFGQLGDGTKTYRDAPVQVHLKQTGSFQLSDSKSIEYDGSHYEYSLYYGYLSSPGQDLSGFWSPPVGFHGTVTVSMISPIGINYDLSLVRYAFTNPSPVETEKFSDGTEFGEADIPEGYAAEWRVKGHSDKDYSQEKVFVYVSIQYEDQ